jgi:hypothetical protein
VTDTQPETRGFPEIKPVDAPPELDRFMTAMRRLQDIAVCTDPDGAVWTGAAERIEELCERLEIHKAPEGVAPAGRAPHLPGLGHPGPSRTPGPTASPWVGTSAASTSAATWPSTAALYRCFRLALWHDRLGRRRPHQPYRLLARGLPRDHARQRTTVSRGRIDSIDGRKAFVSATMTDSDGTVLSEASGLMIRLLPHQP